jgi:hypothetical protein
LRGYKLPEDEAGRKAGAIVADASMAKRMQHGGKLENDDVLQE